jgi:hypothetical protein
MRSLAISTPTRLNAALVLTYIGSMETPAPWSAFRRNAARPAVAAFVAMAAAGLILLQPWALLWAGCAWIVHRRGATEAMRWKVLAWAVCTVAGFAMVVHMASAEVFLGALSVIAAVTTLFVAFLPDAADLVSNAQMTRPSEP